MGVMVGMCPSPVVVRNQSQNPDAEAEAVAHRSGPEERAVPAVVLDHEQPHQEAGRRKCEQERQPVANIQAPEHGVPEHKERNRRRE